MAGFTPTREEFHRLVWERRRSSPEDDAWADIAESTPMWCEACGMVDNSLSFAAFMGNWEWQCPSCGATGMLLWPWDSPERPGPRFPLVPEAGKTY
jgi:hypothetical protein